MLAQFRKRFSRRIADLPGYNLHISPSTLASMSLSGSNITSITGIGPSTEVLAATGSTKPLLTIADGNLNGRNSMLFDGIDDVLLNATYALSQPCTIFLVCYGTTAAGRYMFDGYQLVNPYTQGRLTLLGLSSTVPCIFAGAALIYPATAPGFATPHIFEMVFNGASSELWIDGVSVASGDPGSGGFTAGMILGGRSDAYGPAMWEGSIGDLITFTGAMSASDRAICRAILASENGIPAV